MGAQSSRGEQGVRSEERGVQEQRRIRNLWGAEEGVRRERGVQRSEEDRITSEE